MNKQTIRDWRGTILGYIETDNKGNKTVRDFYNVILGRYNAVTNITTDFNGRKLTDGDTASALLYTQVKK